VRSCISMVEPGSAFSSVVLISSGDITVKIVPT
jgi:hypothetical protein